MMMICQIFLPLDRGYVLNNPLILSIWDLSLELFKTHIISNRFVQARCVNGLLFLIDHERNGELIDRSLVKSLLNMLYKLQVNFILFVLIVEWFFKVFIIASFLFFLYFKLYQSIFEFEFIKASEKLYSNEGVSLLQTLEVPEYLAHVERRFNEENNRLLHYLHPSTRAPLISCLENNLIGEHIANILQKGFEFMLDENRLKDLKLLYQLLNRIPNGVEQLRVAYSNYIKVNLSILFNIIY
jgi:cullin 4